MAETAVPTADAPWHDPDKALPERMELGTLPYELLAGTLGGAHSVSWGVDEEGNAFGWAEDAAGALTTALAPLGATIDAWPMTPHEIWKLTREKA